MNRTFVRTLIAVLTLGSVTLAFQNCAESEHVESFNSEEYNRFFDYQYATKPAFLASINIFRPAGALANLTSFKVYATVAYIADATAPIAYQVKIVNQGGAIVCPTQTGTLAAGSTLVTFDCVSMVATQSARVEFKVTAKGVTQVFEQDYEN